MTYVIEVTLAETGPQTWPGDLIDVTLLNLLIFFCRPSTFSRTLHVEAHATHATFFTKEKGDFSIVTLST